VHGGGGGVAPTTRLDHLPIRVDYVDDNGPSSRVL